MPKAPSSRAERGKSGVRAAWQDVKAEMAREARAVDPPPEHARAGIKAGQWPGYPTDNMPPNCPVVPLGISGKTSFFVDTSGQLIPVATSEWGKKILQTLFAGHHNYLYWCWPRYSEPKANRPSQINGLEVDEAQSCLISEAARRGIFNPSERVRGRGAWRTPAGLVWHGGDRIYRITSGRLEASPPGEIDGIFYPSLPRCTVPWQEPVPVDTSPARHLFQSLQSWNWERRNLDPLLVVGWVVCAFLSGALDWRPHLYTIGDKGVGKSTLHFLIKGLLGQSLHSTADTTPAGIYQRVKQDCLPVAIDELEATADNRRVEGVVTLARLASSGAVMYRGGGEHEGVEFQLRNTFFMSGINRPPMGAADLSRMALLSLGKLDKGAVRPPPLDIDTAGRMMLRQVMDGWPRFGELLQSWRNELFIGGVDSRGQDTWGTLLAAAQLVLGAEAIDAALLGEGEVAETDGRLGAVVARATANDRAEAAENWVECLHYLLGCTIEAWRSGEKPTIGSALEHWETGEWDVKSTNERLALVGLKLLHALPGSGEVPEPAGNRDRPRFGWLAVPVTAAQAPNLARLYHGQKWNGGVWGPALKQAPPDIVIRNKGNGQNVKINRATVRCLLVDMAAYDRWTKKEQGNEG